MTTGRLIHIFAGLFVLVSLSLGVEASPLYTSSNWLWLTAFVGLNLFQSGFTRWCLMGDLLAKLGVPKSA